MNPEGTEGFEVFGDHDMALERANEEGKKYQAKLERLNFLAYEIFELNPFGKELLKEWHEYYICKLMGPERSGLEYHTAQTDFVRMIHGMVASHHNLINKGDKK